MPKNSFIFYRSFSECLKSLPDKERLILYDSIIDYALDEIEPNLDGCLKGMFALIKPQLDANIRRWKNGCKGGAPVGNQNATKNNQETTKEQPKTTNVQPNHNVNDNVNDNVNENVNENENKKEDIKKKQVFQTPTLSEIKDYILEKHYQVDAERFFDYYESNGWRVGKNPMKDWRASVRTWSRSDRQQQPKSDATANICTHFSGDYSEKF
jgi:hypothetical protein